jgi:peptide deformylase
MISMALLTIREIGDPILEKRAKEVKEMTPRLKELVKDMLETMYDANGVGLAAPQIGILKRIVVIDVSPEQNDPHVFINPVIIEQDGEQDGMEGCLSVPGKIGEVIRPAHVKTKAFDENMQPFEIEGTELFARCMCHEFDHLDGILYTTKTIGGLMDTDAPAEDEEDEEEDGEEE